MPNVTLSLDPDLARRSREYAKAHRTTLNDVVRRLLQESVDGEGTGWVQEYFQTADKAKANSRGRRWKREDLYDV